LSALFVQVVVVLHGVWGGVQWSRGAAGSGSVGTRYRAA
jgi:hypothetical protein